MPANESAPRCFVIAPFGLPYDECYVKVLVPAIKDAGLLPLRGDEINKPGVIVNQIWHGITSAAVCLAEVTGRNPNVMYELGVAHAAGKPVVPIVQDVSDLPFDLRSIRFIVYNVHSPTWADELRRKVTSMLQEAMRDPLGSVTLPDNKTGGFRKSLEILIDASETPMFMTDFSRTILHCNQSLADLVRGARADFEGKPFRDSLLPWLAKRVPEHSRQQFVKDQLELQQSFDKREDPKSFAEVYLDNTDFPKINRWKGRHRVRIYAVRLPDNDEGAGYFVVYDVIGVKKIPIK